MKRRQRIRDRVEHWDDERDAGNGIIVTLRAGLSFEPSSHEGVRGFDTERAAMEGVRYACACDPECPDCRELVAAGAVR